MLESDTNESMIITAVKKRLTYFSIAFKQAWRLLCFSEFMQNLREFVQILVKISKDFILAPPKFSGLKKFYKTVILIKA